MRDGLTLCCSEAGKDNEASDLMFVDEEPTQRRRGRLASYRPVTEFRRVPTAVWTRRP